MNSPKQDDIAVSAPAVGQDVLEGAKRGDPGALNAFFDAFFPRVYGYVVNTVRDPELAEDLTQEAFVRIHRNLGRLDPDRDPAPWVFTVVTNLVRDHWRSSGHRMASKRVSLDEVAEPPATKEENGALAAMEREESAAAIREALEALSEADREVILLREYEGLDTAEIAETLGISTEAVRQRFSRAVGRLGKEYRRRVDSGRVK